jgi:hypothetical protein
MKHIILFFIILFCAGQLQAQSLGISLVGASSTGEFRNYVNGAGGITLDFSSPADPTKTAMVFGGDIGYYIYGYKSDQVDLYLSNGDIVYATEERTNSIVSLHGFLRVVAPEQLFRPYAEMVFGGSLFSTSTSVKNRYSDNEISSDWNKATLAWSVGAGAGCMIRIYTPETPGKINAVYLDLRVRYLAGSRTSYLTQQGMVFDPYVGHVVFTPSRSTTDMFYYHLGVQIPLTFTSTNE